MTAQTAGCVRVLLHQRKLLHGYNTGWHLCHLRDRWQRSGVCLAGGGHVCVIAAIVLLLGDDRWKSLH